MTSIFSAVKRSSILAVVAVISTASHASQMTDEASLQLKAPTLMTGVELINQINATLGKHDIDGNPLVNPKQKFIRCDHDFNIKPLFKSWKTIKLTCPSDDKWRLRVRVKINAFDNPLTTSDTNSDSMAIPLPKPKPKPEISTAKSVSYASQDAPQSKHHLRAVALTRSMTKGEVISAADLMMISITPQQNTGIFIKPDDLIGRRVKTAIHANKPIYSHQLAPFYMVEQKKPVTIAFSHQGIYVEMTGVSLENGQFGEVIKVENLSSGKTVFGKVIGNRKISPIH